MLGVSAAVREGAGIQGGDTVEVELELDTQPREVILPPDFKKALDKNIKAKKFFEQLSFSGKQRYVYPLGQAKTEETRQRRMEKAISDLEEGRKWQAVWKMLNDEIDFSAKLAFYKCLYTNTEKQIKLSNQYKVFRLVLLL